MESNEVERDGGEFGTERPGVEVGDNGRQDPVYCQFHFVLGLDAGTFYTGRVVRHCNDEWAIS